MSARATPATSERAEFAGPGGRRGRRRWVTVTVAGVVVVLAAGAVWLAGGFGARGRSGSGNGAGLYGTTTQTVQAGDAVGADDAERDAGVCRVLHGERAASVARLAGEIHLAAAGGPGDPAGPGALPDR